MLLRGYRLVSLAALVITAWAAPASACKNDTSIARGEAEFRSRYEAPNSTPSPRTGYNPWGVTALGVGGGLAASAVVVGLNRRKRGEG